MLIGGGLALYTVKPLEKTTAEKAASLEMCRCDESRPHTEAAREKRPDTRTIRHPLRGVVVDIRPEVPALIVKHEEIKGFMKAMTMQLKVAPQALSLAEKGAGITGQLVRKEDEWWLENVQRLDTAVSQ